jgi:hypothetical protein
VGEQEVNKDLRINTNEVPADDKDLESYVKQTRHVPHHRHHHQADNEAIQYLLAQRQMQDE